MRGVDPRIHHTDDDALPVGGVEPEAVLPLVQAHELGRVGCREGKAFVSLCMHESVDLCHCLNFIRAEPSSEAADRMAIGVDQPGFARVQGGVGQERSVPVFAIDSAKEVGASRRLNMDNVGLDSGSVVD